MIPSPSLAPIKLLRLHLGCRNGINIASKLLQDSLHVLDGKESSSLGNVMKVKLM